MATAPNLTPVGKHCNCSVCACDDRIVAKTIPMKMKMREKENDLPLDWGSRMPTVCRVTPINEKIPMGHARRVPASQSHKRKFREGFGILAGAILAS